VSAAQRGRRDYRAEARRALESAARHCEKLVAEGERELAETTTADSVQRPLPEGTRLPKERKLDAAHGAEITLGRLRFALEALDRGDLELALALACDRLADLTLLIEHTAEGFVSGDERRKGGSAKRKPSARRLEEVQRRMAELRAKNPRAYWSDRSCLLKIHAEALADAAALQRFFPGRAEPTSPESFERWFRERRPGPKKGVKRTS